MPKKENEHQKAVYVKKIKRAKKAKRTPYSG
jgi:hypothetical protein